jgi:hypothetical protein
MKAGQQPAGWTSAMTYKFVGVLRSLTNDKPYQRTAILLGVATGLAMELLRKGLRAHAGYRAWSATSWGHAVDFVLDAIVLPSPYAVSFGGFVNLPTSAWLAAGGVVSSAIEARAPKREGLPADMSATSLFGGGLIAGDALAALALGVVGLIATVL